MTLAIKLLGALLVAAMALLGMRNCTEGLREQGREQVRAEWAAVDARRQADEQAAALERERLERAKELRMQQDKERADAQGEQREQGLRARVADLQRRNDGLRSQLAAAGDASRTRRATGTCAAADAEADAAATARGLLGACADRYGAVAQSAAELASQVIGLQDHVLVLQPQAAALLTGLDRDGERP